MSEIKTAGERLEYHINKEKSIDKFYRITDKNRQLDIYKTAEISDLRCRIKQLEQELAEAKKESLEAKQDSLAAINDQARYQFLRNRALGVHKDDVAVIDDFESVIDAAIKESK